MKDQEATHSAGRDWKHPEPKFATPHSELFEEELRVGVFSSVAGHDFRADSIAVEPDTRGEWPPLVTQGIVPPFSNARLGSNGEIFVVPYPVGEQRGITENLPDIRTERTK